MNIAVIGAGIAGLACARQLIAHGHDVVVFERDGVVGGRIASLRTEIGGFDHGAQYFTTRHPAFVDAGHSAWEPGITAALVRACERMKQLIRI